MGYNGVELLTMIEITLMNQILMLFFRVIKRFSWDNESYIGLIICNKIIHA